jgi:uncharacterized membrane protein
MEIQEGFSILIEQYLAQGGVGWPDLAGLDFVMAAVTPTDVPIPAYITSILGSAVSADASRTAAPTATPGLVLVGERPISGMDGFVLDPLGSSLAVFILLGMVASVVASVVYLRRYGTGPSLPHWMIPVLCVVGLAVAGYLAYVEITLSTAVCGPVGDCNTVQESQYARLFGILPIGVLGMGGYTLILVAWVFGRFGKAELADYARLAMLSLTIFGTLFSIYLTFLEPFVIGAVCAWCLTSAILMTILMLLSTTLGKLAYNHMRHKI